MIDCCEFNVLFASEIPLSGLKNSNIGFSSQITYYVAILQSFKHTKPLMLH